ncbi:putative plastid-lipid-associated protein 8, chloroplastic [Drosera capensis]
MAVVAVNASSPLFSTLKLSSYEARPSSLRKSSTPAPPIRSTKAWQHRRRMCVWSSVSAAAPLEVRAGPDDLVASILAKVNGTDGGVKLGDDGHKEVADMVQELQRYCVDEPVKCPLIFGEWDVVYCSRPTSPGGLYRSALGRLFFQTKEMIQALDEPDTVRNKVSISALGFLDAEVSLKGKLKALDERWVEVLFEPPEVKIGALKFQYNGQSEVKLQITYIDEKIRLGVGSRGSLFVFQRRK